MQIVADFPAYNVIDLDQDIIDWPENTDLKMAIPYQSRNHGTMYRMYYISGVAPYTRKCNAESGPEWQEDVEKAVARSLERGEKMYWISSCSVSITAWKRDKESHVLGKVGQKIRFDGKLFELVHKRDEFYDLKEISE